MTRKRLLILGLVLLSANALVGAREMQPYDWSDREQWQYNGADKQQGVHPYNLGDDVQRHLGERYNDTRVFCDLERRPAFLCNGIILRGTRHGDYDSWDNSPASHASGGVSFSYLRKDSKYTKLAYDYVNGYIFLPVLYAGGKFSPEVLCSFPIDAFSEFRGGRGCGADPGFPGSGPCQAQGITTANAWLTRYRQPSANPRQHQCGFDVSNGLYEGATQAFDATIKAMALISAESFQTQNELRLAVWADGRGADLALEAFFYVNDSAIGRSNAQDEQRRLKARANVTIPVISIWLPKTAAEEATFKYLPTDQVVPLP